MTLCRCGHTRDQHDVFPAPSGGRYGCRHCECRCMSDGEGPIGKTAERAARLDDSLAHEVAVLLEEVRKLPPPTEKERQSQALGFAYSNLMFSPHTKPSRAMFCKIARSRYGWTADDFDAWAEEREWTQP